MNSMVKSKMNNTYNRIFLGSSIFLLYLDGIFPQVYKIKMTSISPYNENLNETAIIIKTYETDADKIKHLEQRIRMVYNTATVANTKIMVGNSSATQALDILNNGLVRIGAAPNTTSGYGLVVDQPNDGASNIGIKVSANNHTAFLGIGYDKITTAGGLKLEGNGGIQLI